MTELSIEKNIKIETSWIIGIKRYLKTIKVIILEENKN